MIFKKVFKSFLEHLCVVHVSGSIEFGSGRLAWYVGVVVRRTQLLQGLSIRLPLAYNERQ